MEIVMNHEQYLQWKNGYKTTIDIKLENYGIKNSKLFKRQLIIGIGTTLFMVNNPCKTLAINTSGIDTLGNTFLEVARKLGYWIALISAIVEIIKSSMKSGNSNSDLWKIAIKYLLLYASLYLLPTLFDMVREAF